MDPVTFKGVRKKNFALWVETVTFRPFWSRDMPYPFIYRRTCCPLAIIFNIIIFCIISMNENFRGNL